MEAIVFFQVHKNKIRVKKKHLARILKFCYVTSLIYLCIRTVSKEKRGKEFKGNTSNFRRRSLFTLVFP